LKLFFAQSLTGIKGLSEAKVDKICEAAEKIVVSLSLSLSLCLSFSIAFQAKEEFAINFDNSLVVLIGIELDQNFGYMTGSDALLRVRSDPDIV